MKVHISIRFRFLFYILFSLYNCYPSNLKCQSLDKNEQYQKILDNAVNKGLPAVSVLIKPDNQPLWKGVSGFKNLENKTPININESFRLASITKLFTSIIVLKLVDENKIKLSDKIAKYVDKEIINNIPNHENITILHLLSHSSGVYSFTENNSFWNEAYLKDGMSRTWKPEELLAYIKNKKPVNKPVEPFTSSFYSNTNYILLGYIIQNITGNSLADEYQNRIFNPLKLENTYFEGFHNHQNKIVDSYAIPKGFTLKKAVSKKKIKVIRDDKLINLCSTYSLYNSWAWAAGGICSNTSDLYTFLTAIREGKLLSEKSNKTFNKLYTSVDKGVTYYGGTGGSEGIQTTMLYLKPLNIEIIILINSTGHKEINLGSVFKELIAVAMNKN